MTTKTINNSAEISNLAIARYLLAQKMWILTPTFLIAVLSVIIVLMLPNIYRSDALLIPNSQTDSTLSGGLGSNLGGLASLAGLDLDSGESESVSIAIEVMKSRKFIHYFIEKYELEAVLFATTGWNRETNSLIFDREVYSTESKAWSDDERMTKQEIHEAFLIDHFGFESDKEAGTYRFSIRHYSPYVAQEILKNFIFELNELMRKRAIADAEVQLEYLSDAIEHENRNEMTLALYELATKYTKQKMLAEVRDDYVFKTLDPAIVPEKKFAPKRGVICIIAVLSSLLFFSLIQILRMIFRDSDNA
ncbi:Wzz/FepE/Etk N-terminal domain-containing protein [Pseudoalteromonas piscicida]|nr:Wzz/FepE/Etk N-terminal domain-containing protein [Pseudoalteromonas piscicida]